MVECCDLISCTSYILNKIIALESSHVLGQHKHALSRVFFPLIDIQQTSEVDMLGFKVCIIALLATLALSAVFPTPKHEHYPPGSLDLASPCQLFLTPTRPSIQLQDYFDKITQRINKGVACSRQLLYRSDLHTLVQVHQDASLARDAYNLQVDNQGITITHSSYPGYIYALETLSQVIREGLIPFCNISDEPLVEHRGVMIDSSRHFLSVKIISRLLQSMPLVKLNVLHWHLANDESFPISLGTHPQLAQYASYGRKSTYSLDDIREILRVATLNGVTVIPELESPSHVRSWGQAPQWKNSNITIKCDGGYGYTHQFDISKPAVYELVKDVLHEVGAAFKSSPHIHLGGRGVSEDCWKKRPGIATFMKLRNIHTFNELQSFWRYELKQALTQGKKVIFWAKDGSGAPIGKEDVVQYYGSQNETAANVGGYSNKIILSPSDYVLLNSGQGDVWQKDSYGTYSVWKDIINHFTVHPDGVDKSRILGAEAVLEGYLVNEDIFENDLWPRAGAFAYRAWTDHQIPVHQAVEGLVQIKEKLEMMGVDPSPITSEFCEGKPAICWPEDHKSTDSVTVAQQ